MTYAILERHGVVERVACSHLFGDLAAAQRVRDDLDRELTCREGSFTPEPTFHVVEIGRWIEGAKP